MLKIDRLEASLVQVFRLFIWIRLALLSLGVCLWLVSPDQRQQQFPFLGMAETAFLVIYLSWGWLRNTMGRVYLPVALVIASAGPIVESSFNVALRLLAQHSTDAGGEAVILIIVLFIPLLVVSWQYKFRAVVAFCLGTSILDILLAVPIRRFGGPAVGDIFGIVLLRSVLFMLVGFIVVRLMSAQRSQRQALGEANTRLASYASTLEQLTISRERNRLARDLHDTLAHTLSGLAVQLEAINTLWENDPASARHMLEQSLSMTRTGLVESRRAIEALRAAPLEDMGLAVAIRSLTESVALRAGLKTDIYASHSISNLTPEVEQTLYRIADEALNNVVHHANAKQVKVRLEQPNTQQVRLLIADDGCGFDASQHFDNGHYGLRGLRERAELIRADLNIASKVGEGTAITLTLETTP